nr:GntR family transcriptional regulator [Clostridiales bacterium]
NPNTIQRAYRELESEGYIYVAAGKGTFISPKGEMKADTKKLMETFREVAAKLVFNGVSCDELEKEVEAIGKEVRRDD